MSSKNISIQYNSGGYPLAINPSHKWIASGIMLDWFLSPDKLIKNWNIVEISFFGFLELKFTLVNKCQYH